MRRRQREEQFTAILLSAAIFGIFTFLAHLLKNYPKETLIMLFIIAAIGGTLALLDGIY